MKQKAMIVKMFNRFLFLMRALVLACVVVVPGMAATDDACLNEDNDAIAAEFALCSTHAYNIGRTDNPDAAGRKLMNDVIGLKTTFITQQMYRQYEQMESMLKRFKTQLEKAVLTANLKAAGAKSSTETDSANSSSFKSTDRNVLMEGARNCHGILDELEQIQCYNENYILIRDVTQNGQKPTVNAKKQLARDMKNLKASSCNDANSMGTREKFQTCLDDYIKKIQGMYRDVQNNNNQANALRGLFGSGQQSDSKTKDSQTK